jgi:hypothetical protein
VGNTNTPFPQNGSRMTDTTAPAAHRRRRRVLPLVWMASAFSAAVLILGVNGTLSAWTSAIITNDTNTVATANALILKEAGPDGTAAHTAQTCYSSTGSGNTYSCSTINKYGGTTSPLSPGQSQQTDVTFTNVGGASGASFKLAAGTCSQTPGANPAAAPPINNLCSASGELTVAVSCTDGATYTGTPWTDLKYAAGTANGIGTLTHTAPLAANASWTCRFTVALNANASVTDQGIVVSQPLTWTLA